MRYLSLPSTDPHYNMAFDEFALQGLDLEEPVFYLWQNRPSVIIGLNQSPYAEVNLPFLEERGIVLARRVTGGGAVYHDLQNLNYTITGRARDLQAAYPEYLHMVIDALRQLGVAAELSGRNDILVDGRKCSGFAKRLWKDRLMVHGTLMYDVDIDTLTRALAVPGSKLAAAGIASVRSRVANLRAYLPAFSGIDSFRTALQEILSGGDGEILLTTAQKAAVARDADTRFRTWQWNFGRSPRADFCLRRRLPCGTVEAAFSLPHGRIRDLRFGGDFLGNLPAEAMETLLEGCPYTEEALAAALSGVDTRTYFDGLETAALIGFLLGR